jgi:hypothetical protein
MSVSLELRWLYPHHPLLQSNTFDILLDGASVKPKTESRGIKRFSIADEDIVPGKTTLLLKGRFTHSVKNKVNLKDVDGNKVGTADPMSSDVLTVEQKYNFVSTSRIISVTEPPFAGNHPLIIDGSVQKSARITIDTTFVDVTEFWKNYSWDWQEYSIDSPDGITFRALAYTGNQQNTWIWLASVPKICKTKSDVGVLVHFPYPVTNYTGIGESQDMWYPNRHLLEPDPVAPPSDMIRRLRFTAGSGDWGFVKRGGFLKSLIDSGKPVVLFYLSPKIAGFGPASQSSLSNMTRSALRFLHAQQIIGNGEKSIARARFAVSVYSGGGLSALSALVANSNVIDEFYAMDAASLYKTPNPATVKTWFEKRVKVGVNPCLRLTGWLQRGVNRTLFSQCSGISGGSVSISPPANIGIEDFYLLPTNPPDPAKPDVHGSAWWNECLAEFSGTELDNARKNEFARHQFALQGGPGAPADGHYMYHFLKNSGF